jgi:hypothetical protein
MAKVAYNISDERLLELMITDPSYCLFYHREKVRRLLPSLARAYILVSELQKELITKHYDELAQEAEKTAPIRDEGG